MIVELDSRVPPWNNFRVIIMILTKVRFFPAIIFLGVLFFTSAISFADNRQEGRVLPRPPQPFEGVLEPTEDESTPVKLSPVKAPKGAPNILLVLTDDAGFSSVRDV